MNANKFLILLLAVITLTCCKDNKGQNQVAEEASTVTKTEPTETASNIDVSGNYVTDDYNKRSEGHDWVAIIVNQISDNAISVKVRSRADKKRGTCTFDTRANKKDDTAYAANISGKTVLFTFKKGIINITTENPADEAALFFYCSGGATFAGDYSKLNGDLDASQIDKTLYSKVLILQDIGFNISAIDKKGKTELTVNAFGLKENHGNPQVVTFKGDVVDAEVEDLDSDGSPELVVYTESNGYGNVLAFSTLKKNSIIPVYFPPTSENTKINEGYKGQDEFSLVENTLAQRFPTDRGSKQVIYRLVNGEAGKNFEMTNVSEF
ncbi:hypothetical protein Q4566_03825 [Tamlana sp. 2_MG-2023]|uniref:hypothetical protein n=1 Tax=unclassified Tamlana TaxID=2614803 RepID=UPI0026E2D806|nr:MULTISPECIES: hypothetical protein [unclassified Tamlana]MDO6759317.1 hypothetical protein [Tamlana sp. 2_MG-2023]MDO6790544.1 hypothetical protein [Tamlana sp. 1_MG-2023]